MGCSCGSGKNGSVAGCQNNGACRTGGCNKMNVFDWLSNMDMPVQSKFDVVEVRFKGGRKDFFRNSEHLSLTTGDAVVVEVPNGHHLGHVSLQGELVRLQMQKKKVTYDQDVKRIYRLAHQRDVEKLDEVRKRELPALYRSREIIRQYKLEMKLSDVEFQADNSKATFFYSAEDRVDFRELIKVLAAEFKVRIEMRQISLRQEAGRLGGIGVCGRELCCSTWLTDFKNVATSAARYQNLSLNPSKLSGQCGRLKCCLNYELETYMEALEDIPKVEGPLLTERGEATLQKTDIFRKIMWFGFREDNTWYPVNVSRVNEILNLNKEGKKPATLEENVTAEKEPVSALNSDLVSLDKKFKNKPNKKKRGRDRNRGNQNQGQSQNQNRNQNNPNNSGNPGNQRNQPNQDNQGNQGRNPRNQGNQSNQGNQGNRGNQRNRGDQGNRGNRGNQGNPGSNPGNPGNPSK